MQRSFLDRIVSWIGLGLTVVLIVAGSLLTWAHHFVSNEVKTQLSAQQIYFPPKGSPATAGSAFTPMRQYAGQQLTTGAQAETYADHFIAVHLKEVANGQTYAQLSAKAQANPDRREACRPGSHDVQGRDLTRAAPERIRIRHDGDHRRHRRDRCLHRRGADARPVATRPAARTSHTVDRDRLCSDRAGTSRCELTDNNAGTPTLGVADLSGSERLFTTASRTQFVLSQITPEPSATS